jgi:hypothetical protein
LRRNSRDWPNPPTSSSGCLVRNGSSRRCRSICGLCRQFVSDRLEHPFLSNSRRAGQIMRKQTGWIVVCCLCVVLLGGCASSGGILHGPLGNRSIAKQAENDPFPTASQVGLARTAQK